MTTVNRLKAFVNNSVLQLSSTDSELSVSITIKKGVLYDVYEVIVMMEGTSSVSAEISTNGTDDDSLCKVWYRGSLDTLISEDHGKVIYFKEYKVSGDNSTSTISLCGTDAYGNVSWTEDECTIVIDLSDDRIYDEDATDKVKMVLIALMIAQSIIVTKGDSSSHLCTVYKDFYDSLTSS